MTDDIIAWVEPRTSARSDHKLGRLFDRMDDDASVVHFDIVSRFDVERAYFPLMVYRAVYRKMARPGMRSLGVVMYHTTTGDDIVIARAFNPA